MQRILVIGAGAMGCLFAARIAESGADVMLIDVDTARLAAIAREGITLTDDNGTRSVPMKTGTANEATGPFDLALLFTKGLHSSSATRSLAHLAVAGGPYMLTLQNGLGNPEIIAETFPQDRILKGIAALPADLHDATHVSSHGSGHLELGGMTPAGAQAAEQAAVLLARSGFDARTNAMIDVAIWEKVAFNAALNALGTVTLQTNAGVNNGPGRRIAAAMVAEVAATAHACGVPVDAVRINASIDFALTHHGGHQASMLQDRIAGRATEIESINGAVCERAAAKGVPTPVTSTMTDLVRLIELNPSR
ncbi:MAG: ketopantoate reductase family protein [Sphingobium sp.]|nr:ketopantoate reductase family protein [Sphingobium sp.]